MFKVLNKTIKHMKDLKIHFVLIIIFFISCFCSKNNSRNQENNGIYEIVISHELNNEIKASSFIEDYKIVQLSTSNDNLIFFFF